MSAKSLLCLSSGLAPQYRLDILKSLALPRGTYVQFRYSEDIIATSLRTPLARNEMCGAKVLLAHVDCNLAARQSNGLCTITPCRYSVLVSSRKLGSFYFLQFRVEEFAYWGDSASSQQEIRGDRPCWDNANQLSGLWCLEFEISEQAWLKEKQLEGWQNVIKLLKKSEDFAKEPFFFAVEGLYVRGEEQPCEATDGEFVLRSERDYAIRIFHFHPDADKHKMTVGAGVIKVDVSQPQIEAVTSPTLPVASPYDLKSFHFRTAASPASRFGSIVVRCTQDGGEPNTSQPELFIPTKVKLAWFRATRLILAIAALLFAQQYLSAQAKGAVSEGIVVALVLLALATAVVAVLGLKKPV
jgi:hypothetical protein